MRARLACLLVTAVAMASCSTTATSPAPTPSAALPTSPAPAGSVAPPPVVGRDWEAVDVPELTPSIGGGPVVRDAVTGPDGFIAVGMRPEPDSPDGVPSSWTSADGRTWVRGGDLPVPAGLVGADVQALARAGDAFVAVGDSLESGAIAWTSADGTTWSSSILDKGACALDVAAREDLVVVVGLFGPCHSGGGGHPAVWVSRDGGGSWARGSAPGRAGVWGFFGSLVATRERFVAFGSFSRTQPVDTCGDSCPTPGPMPPYGRGPWVSEDGSSWRRTADPALFSGAFVEQVVTGPAGLAAFARTLDGGSTLWVSHDGQRWTVAPEWPFRTSSDLVIGGSPAALVALASDPDRDRSAPSSAVASDGIHWVVAPTPRGLDGGGAYLIVPFRDGLVAFGLREEPLTAGGCPATKTNPETCRTTSLIWLSPPVQD